MVRARTIGESAFRSMCRDARELAGIDAHATATWVDGAIWAEDEIGRLRAEEGAEKRRADLLREYARQAPTDSLRDRFAMAALTGLLAHPSGEDPHKAPEMAYVLADEMLKAREVSVE